MSKNRHSLETLSDIVKWIDTNDIGEKSAGSWDLMHKRVLGMNEGSYLDISALKSNSRGAKMVKGMPEGYKRHDSLALVWQDDASYDIYRQGTGLGT